MKQYAFIGILLSGLSLLISHTPLFATDTFLASDMGSSAKMIAIGNIDGFSQDAAAIFENPAALHTIHSHSLSFFKTSVFNDATYINMAAARQTRIGTIGLGHMQVGVNDLSETDIDQSGRFFRNALFNYTNTVTKLGYQLSPLPALHIGLTGSYFTSQLADLASQGWNLDLGTLIELGKGRLSLLGKNVLLNQKAHFSNNRSARYPPQLILSGSYSFTHCHFYAQSKAVSKTQPIRKALGFSLAPSWLPLLQIHIGHKDFFAQNKIKTANTIGLSLALDSLHFHYAYEKNEHPEFDALHFFSLSLNY